MKSKARFSDALSLSRCWKTSDALTSNIENQLDATVTRKGRAWVLKRRIQTMIRDSNKGWHNVGDMMLRQARGMIAPDYIIRAAVEEVSYVKFTLHFEMHSQNHQKSDENQGYREQMGCYVGSGQEVAKVSGKPCIEHFDCRDVHWFMADQETMQYYYHGGISGITNRVGGVGSRLELRAIDKFAFCTTDELTTEPWKSASWYIYLEERHQESRLQDKRVHPGFKAVFEPAGRYCEE